VSFSPEQILFAVFALAIIVSSGGVIFARNAIASAMSLVACFFFLAGTYVLLWAHTVAALQVLVYAGAIMVLFLFVIMLLTTSSDGPTMSFSVSRVAGSVAVAGMFGALTSVFVKLPAPSYAWTNDADAVANFGTIARVGEVLYTKWLFPFEAVSLLLLVAILGAVVVAKARV
jgi:NADH-quinone oxidoreductase subunit J